MSRARRSFSALNSVRGGLADEKVECSERKADPELHVIPHQYVSLTAAGRARERTVKKKTIASVNSRSRRLGRGQYRKRRSSQEGEAYR